MSFLIGRATSRLAIPSAALISSAVSPGCRRTCSRSASRSRCIWSVVRRVPLGDGRRRDFDEAGFAFDRRGVEEGVVATPSASSIAWWAASRMRARSSSAKARIRCSMRSSMSATSRSRSVRPRPWSLPERGRREWFGLPQKSHEPADEVDPALAGSHEQAREDLVGVRAALGAAASAALAQEHARPDLPLGVVVGRWHALVAQAAQDRVLPLDDALDHRAVRLVGGLAGEEDLLELLLQLARLRLPLLGLHLRATAHQLDDAPEPLVERARDADGAARLQGLELAHVATQMEQAQRSRERLAQLVVRLRAVGHEHAGEVLEEVLDLAAAARIAHEVDRRGGAADHP